MRFAAQVLSLALIPGLAAAQGSPQVAQQGTAAIGSESDTTAPLNRVDAQVSFRS